MEKNESESVFLSKGFKFQELMLKGGTEFHIDVNWKDKKAQPIFEENELMNDDNDSSGMDDVLKKIDKKLLNTPEYHTFDELAAKMTDCMSTGDVKILIMEEGDESLVPTDAVVLIHYAAYWEKENIPFDTTLVTENAAPRKFRLGTGTLLPGLEIGISMVRGPKAKFQLLLTPAVTWGELGVLKRIRNERSLFCVTLLEVRDVGAVERFNSLPSDEQKKFEVTVKTVTASNLQAKDYFIKKNYKKAVHNYHKSLSVLQLCETENEQQLEEIKNLLAKVYTNLAICYYKLHLPNKVLLMCDDLGRCIDINNNCKGLFYYGKAFTMLGDYDQAFKYYNRALKLEPKNSEIAKALLEIDKIMTKAAEKEKDMWRTVFKFNPSQREKELQEFEVDEDFKNCLKETCEDLNGRDEFVKINLPSGLLKKEIEYVKMFLDGYDTLYFVEENVSGRKKFSLIKKV